MGPKLESGLKMLFLWLFAYPGISALLSLLLAGPIAAAEGTSFANGFLFSLMAMTLTGIPITGFVPGSTPDELLRWVMDVATTRAYTLAQAAEPGAELSIGADESLSALVQAKKRSMSARSVAICFKVGAHGLVGARWCAVVGRLRRANARKPRRNVWKYR